MFQKQVLGKVIVFLTCSAKFNFIQIASTFVGFAYLYTYLT